MMDPGSAVPLEEDALFYCSTFYVYVHICILKNIERGRNIMTLT